MECPKHYHGEILKRSAKWYLPTGSFVSLHSGSQWEGRLGCVLSHGQCPQELASNLGVVTLVLDQLVAEELSSQMNVWQRSMGQIFLATMYCRSTAAAIFKSELVSAPLQYNSTTSWGHSTLHTVGCTLYPTQISPAPAADALQVLASLGSYSTRDMGRVGSPRQ